MVELLKSIWYRLFLFYFKGRQSYSYSNDISRHRDVSTVALYGKRIVTPIFFYEGNRFYFFRSGSFCDTTEQLLLCQYFEHATSGSFVDDVVNDPTDAVSRFPGGRRVGIVVEPLLEQASKFRGFTGLVAAKVALTDERKVSRRL